jgi:hypothetical protein
MQVSVFIFFLKMNGRGRTKMLMHINTTSVLADVNKYDIFFISLTDANKFPPVSAEKPKNSLQLSLNRWIQLKMDLHP